MTSSAKFQRLRDLAARLRRDSSGLALIEFAYSMPLLIVLSFYGLEMTNLAVTNLKISQATSAMADNMSRIGLESALSTVQLRESDINDSFEGMKRQTAGLDLFKNGRVTVSSLEQNASGGQWIRWQRCKGEKNYPSTYGTVGDGATGTAFPGMGPASARVTSPTNQDAVMFVEVRYDYKSLFSTMFVENRQLRYYASFLVRDQRDLAGPDGGGVYNPAPAATPSTCNLFNST
jgi:Flp pilus assembly protein TadG